MACLPYVRLDMDGQSVESDSNCWHKGSCGMCFDIWGPRLGVAHVAHVGDNVDGVESRVSAVALDVCLRSNLDLKLLLQHLLASAAQPADDYRSSCRLG